MKKLSGIDSVRIWRSKQRGKIVLVPTMGALHSGHLALIRRAKSLAGPDGCVVVSIFVNPTQFGPNEDFKKYPRDLQRDLKLCREAGVELVFSPSVEKIYSADASTMIEETQVSEPLCGSGRPGHFSGVCTIVAKLFLILSPDVAIFGEKDWQQLVVLRRMVRDLNFPVRIVSHQIVREVDGLAMSSRNQYLTAPQRTAAPEIYAALQAVKKRAQAGEKKISSLRRFLISRLKKISAAEIEYAEILEAETLQPLQSSGKKSSSQAIAAVAVKLGNTRLIDNIRFTLRT
ncbi:MAG: pantoate--beta-alanine ligase [Chthoniobacterales bacterium]